MIKQLSFVLFISLIMACGGTKKTSTTVPAPKGMHWMENVTLTETIEKAQAENKLVFIDFYADWCAPCKMMDKEVYSDKYIYKDFNQDFINFKVNGEKGHGPNLALLYQVQVYPTLLWVDYNGRVLARKDGAAYHTELKRLAKKAKNQFEGT